MAENASSRKMDKVSVSNSNADKSIKMTWNTIPPEVLEKILTPLYSPFKPKDMARLREVCTHWRDVIDEHFNFRLTVNDKKMDVTKLSHLRLAPSVVVSSLVVELDPQVSIFKDATEITELKIWGEIAHRNFQQLLIDAVNLKQLSLNAEGFCAMDLMKPIPTMEFQFKEALERLTSLNIDIVLNLRGSDNLFEILSTEMPNLQIFKLSLNISTLQTYSVQYPSNSLKLTEDLFSFINRCRSINGFHMSPQCAFSPFYHHTRQLPVYAGDKQLETLRLTAIHPSIWRCWLPLVQEQRSLKCLQIAITSIEYPPDSPPPPNLCLITALEATFQLNRTTLTCIQLKNLGLSEDLNAEVFAEMSNLSHLELQRYQKNPFDRFWLIFNLGMLPNSIEVLNLRGFTCDRADLLQMADRLEKIKHVDLVDIYNAANGDRAVSYLVLESFSRKVEIRSMTIFPVNTVLDNPHERVNGKHFLLVNGFRIEVLFGRGDYYVKFNFGK